MFGTEISQHSLFFEMLSYELKSFLLDVPYTSVTQFHEFLGNQTIPQNFGVSCVWQAYLLGERLVEKGFADIRYLYDGRHVALIAEADGMQFLLDPYLLHTSPLFLDWKPAQARSEKTVESYAYPYRKVDGVGYKPSKLQVTQMDAADKLRLTYKRFSPSRGHYVAARVFNMSMSRLAPDTPPTPDIVKPLLHHGEQNNLSIRIVHRKDHCLYELVYPIALHHLDEVHAEHLLFRDNNGRLYPWSDKEIRATFLKRMAESIGATPSGIVDFVLEGARIYEAHAPVDIAYAPFTLKDE